jgi:hypothetical protein
MNVPRVEPTRSSSLLLPAGTRLVHIGPPKTGTTGLQAALYRDRAALEAQGVHFAGRSRHSASAVAAAIGRRAHHRRTSPSIWRWRLVLRDIRASRAPRVVLSSESFSYARPDAIRRVVADLDPTRVQVVVTLRPLARIIPSAWQQHVVRGLPTDYDTWLESTIRRRESRLSPSFWYCHRHDELIERWAEIVGSDRLTAVVVDEHDHGSVLRAFEQLTGLRDGTLRPIQDAENRSLTLHEVEAVRAFNNQFRHADLDMLLHDRVMTLGAVRYMKHRQPAATEPRIVTPQWALDIATEIATEMVDRIRRSGIRVIGDVASLAAPVSGLEDAPGPRDAIPATVAASMGMGILLSTGVSRHGNPGGPVSWLLGRAVEPGEIASVASYALVAVLINRVVRSVTTAAHAVWRRRPGWRRRSRNGPRAGRPPLPE